MKALLRSYLALLKAVAVAFRSARVQALLLLCCLIAAAQSLILMRIEGWTFVDGFYFSVVSMATVGYGDLSPDTTLGKLTTLAFLVVGIGVFVLTVSSIAEAILRDLRNSEDFGEGAKRRRERLRQDVE